ncbi:MAG: HIRAN domain-containing protein [Coriobacteriia bacterium]|nr:HIRAN domain-containing protein [Coriobacteriia bacterium]
MYTPSRNIVSCHLSGFAYYEGMEVFKELEVGTPLELAAEPDNPYDSASVRVGYQGKKIGYIPQAHNDIISQLLVFGHGDIVEAQVNRITPDAAPERQIGIVVRVKDAR